MRDETELRSAIDTLAGPQPDAGALHDRLMIEVSAETPNASAGRRVFMPLLVAAAVAVLAIGGVLLAGNNHPNVRQPAGGSPSAAMRWQYVVGHVPGYAIVRGWVVRQGFPDSNIEQNAEVTATGHSLVSGLLVYDIAPPRTVTAGSAFTRKGVRYYYRSGGHVRRQGGLTAAQYGNHPWWAAQQDAHGPQLAWRYADGSQVILTGTFGFRPGSYDYDNARARSDMLRIAQAMRIGQGGPVRMPFGVADAPDGLVAVSVREDAPDSRAAQRSFDGADSITYACLNYTRPDKPGPLDFTASVFTVCRVAGGAAAVEAILPRRQVDARIVRRLPDGTRLVVASGAGHGRTVTRADLARIAEHTDVSPELGKRGSWTPVN